MGKGKPFSIIDEGELFRIDFTLEFKGSATVSLYNVNNTTINMVKSSIVSGRTKFANLLTEFVNPKQYNGILQTILKQFLLDNGFLSYEILALLGMDLKSWTTVILKARKPFLAFRKQGVNDNAI
jgi:hypothetical protein